MRRLIRADFNRILLKKEFYILLIVSLIYAVGMTIKDMSSHVRGGYSVFLTYKDSSLSFSFLFGLITLLAVYGDEFSSLVMDGVIGRGISRVKYVMVKFLDSLSILLFLFITYGLVTYIPGAVMAGGLNADENGMFFMTMMTGIISTLAYVTIAAMFLYISGQEF